MEGPEHLQNKAILLEPALHARCGHSSIAIQEISRSRLTATHFDRIYLGQSRILVIPSEDAPLLIPCRVSRSQVTDWRDEKTGKCLYRSVFEFLDLTPEMRQTLEELLLAHDGPAKKSDLPER
jgi:hypothetical protein